MSITCEGGKVVKYTESHEWISMEGSVGIVGVSSYAQSELGDIVYVELPKVGAEVTAGEEVAVLESTKAAADVYTPLSGVIEEVNEQLLDQPELVNDSPEGEGWLFKLKVTQPEELERLMDQEKYKTFVS